MKNKRILFSLVLGMFVSLLLLTSFCIGEAADEEVIEKVTPTYLADLKPLAQSTEYIVNKDPEGNPLQTPKMKFKNGLCVTTNSELIYDLKGKYSKLQIAFGHSSAYPEFKGKLVFSILGDGKVLYESKSLGAQETEEITVKVAGVGHLALRVSGQGANSRFIIWGEGLLY